MQRRRFSGGTLESNKAFAARKFCSPDCVTRAKLSRGPQIKQCTQCGKDFTRRRSPSGYIEPLVNFESRRFCSRECAYPAAEILPQISSERWRALYWAHDSGYPSMASLAMKFGVSETAIARALRNNGIKVRTNSEQMRLEWSQGRRAESLPNPPPPITPEHRAKLNTPERRKAASEFMRSRQLWKVGRASQKDPILTRACFWCSCPITAPAWRFGRNPHYFCSRSCSGRHSQHRRFHPGEPRPLFVARLGAHLKDRLPIRESLETLATEIGASEDEVTEALVNACLP